MLRHLAVATLLISTYGTPGFAADPATLGFTGTFPRNLV